MAKNILDVHKIGTKVKLGEDIIATITAVGIRDDNYITYECGWWNGRSYDTKWFHSNEVEVTDSEKLRIGFA